jgi:hypothetical protein
MGKGMWHRQLFLFGLAALAVSCVPELDRTVPDTGVTIPDASTSKYDFSFPGSDAPIYPSDVAVGDGLPEAAAAPDTLVDCGPDPDLTVTPDQLQPDTFAGKWYQANSKSCPDFCNSLGMTNKPSPEGTRCMSGEVRPASGINQGIQFSYGCWGGCAPNNPSASSSDGKYCYMPGQKKDNDSSDITVGCFCG